MSVGRVAYGGLGGAGAVSKPGDVVEFRSGLHGIESPRNLGILLDRYRRKGVPWVKIITVDGPKEIKAEHLSRRVFRDRYEGSLTGFEEVGARLRFLIERHGEGGLVEESEDDLSRLEEALWEATCDAGQDAWSEEEIAAAHYGADASRQQLRDVRECLNRCRRPGIGRFETVGGRGDTWRPWSRDEQSAMRRAWDALVTLQRKLVTVEETEEGRAFVRVEWAEAGLDDADLETLQWIKAAMVQFVEWDGVPAGQEPVAGVGGYAATNVFGMQLHRRLRFLAQDWIRSESTNTSSDYVHFLLESGLWRPDDAVASLMRRHVNQEPFFEHVPDARAAEAAEALPEPDLAQDPNRTDLRSITCYTIDPPDAKDFDDAVGIQTNDDGTTTLWVHIADVSHYVTPGTALDDHAKKRATSVYLPGRVLPMLPHRIADHLCSLRDDGDRFAMSAELHIDPDGRVAGANFHKAIIRVTENLSYDEALTRADRGESPFTDLLELATRMRRHRRGLALETGERKVILEESGFDVLVKHANPATRMIETFMVAANEAVARHLADKDIPLLYRCHPLPDPTKAERFGHQLQTMGFELPFELPETARSETREGATQSLLDTLKSGGGKLNLFGGGLSIQGAEEDEPEPAVDDKETAADVQGFAALSEEEREAWLTPFRTVVDHLTDMSDKKRAEVATLKLLGCMGRAYYTPDNEGHFGLASTHYAHFTSPIRRYPDLVVHRNLKWLITGGPDAGQEMPHPKESLESLCDHCSDQERAADGLERRIRASGLVLATLQAGESSQAARVTGLTPASLFVLRDDGIEARVPARELPGGPYQVDEWESMLYVGEREAPQRFNPEDLKALIQYSDPETGEMMRVRAKLADTIQVTLAGRDVANGKTEARVVGWGAGKSGGSPNTP